jgi:hypothetical protein
MGGIQGACFFWPASLLVVNPTFHSCVPDPQCNSYPLDFKLTFRRCNWVPVLPCDATCILANSPWTMTIIGKTAEFVATSTDQVICEGECVTLTATVDYGLPPYTFTWFPDTLAGNSVTVCPATTTQYSVVVTDSCGLTTDTAFVNVAVIPNANPGFSLLPEDTVCDGTNLFLSANGNAPSSSYDWSIACGSLTTYNDTQLVSFFAPPINGVCTAILNYEYDTMFQTCIFADTQTFIVNFCSGIDDLFQLEASVFPNPADKNLTILCSTGELKDILFLDVLGKILIHQNSTALKTELDVSALLPGVYFLLITEGKFKSVHKILIL